MVPLRRDATALWAALAAPVPPVYYDPATFDVDGAPFPPHILDGACWCDPTIEAIYGRNHPAPVPPGLEWHSR
jgi:hypothetical protein